MKITRAIGHLIYSLVLLLFVTSCGNKSSNSGVAISSGGATVEKPTDKPDNLKILGLGKSEDFALLAYSNITSTEQSFIRGKVGLMPGMRNMLKLGDDEIEGGAPNIMAADDETDPPNLLSNAKVDMVSAYLKLAALSPDSDKNELNSSLGGKKLKPGIYKWIGDLRINTDFSLEGDDKALWIFKVPGHLKIGESVKMVLNGKAKATNVFWQVSGSVILESSTEFSGTIFAQQFIELRNKSVLNGRAFVKNGHINLIQAAVTKPQ